MAESEETANLALRILYNLEGFCQYILYEDIYTDDEDGIKDVSDVPSELILSIQEACDNYLFFITQDPHAKVDSSLNFKTYIADPVEFLYKIFEKIVELEPDTEPSLLKLFNWKEDLRLNESLNNKAKSIQFKNDNKFLTKIYDNLIGEKINQCKSKYMCIPLNSINVSKQERENLVKYLMGNNKMKMDERKQTLEESLFEVKIIVLKDPSKEIDNFKILGPGKSGENWRIYSNKSTITGKELKLSDYIVDKIFIEVNKHVVLENQKREEKK